MWSCFYFSYIYMNYIERYDFLPFSLNPYPAKLNNYKFYALEVVVFLYPELDYINIFKKNRHDNDDMCTSCMIVY